MNPWEVEKAAVEQEIARLQKQLEVAETVLNKCALWELSADDIDDIVITGPSGSYELIENARQHARSYFAQLERKGE